MYKKILIIIFTFAFIHTAFSVPKHGIVAYPVPFNPNLTTLKIGYPLDALLSFNGNQCVEYTIYDVNGDEIISQKSIPTGKYVIWNGRNKQGSKVKAGLYIIKVVVKDSQTGGEIKKVIRILVNR